MAVSMHDVARHAGVSQRTVSNVVTGSVTVAPATRARVEESLRTLGYRPNVAARRLRSGRTGTVTLAIPSLAERYFADLAEAVIARSRAEGIDVLIETTGADHDRELAILAGRSGLLTDGVVMSAVTIGSGDGHVERAPYPLVLVGDHEFDGPVDHVGIPNRRAARAAVEHLVERGCRRIAVLGVSDGPSESASLRMQGYRAALRGAGIAVDEDLVLSCDWTHEGGLAAAARLVALPGGLPDGVFAMNDSLALGVLDGFARRGVAVPGAVAVIGFDDILEARHTFPTLSSVGPSLDAIASEALQMLAAQTADPDRTPVRRHVPFAVHVRESSAR